METIIWTCPTCSTENYAEKTETTSMCAGCRGKFEVSKFSRILTDEDILRNHGYKTPEKTLTTVANIVLWVNIVACVILFIVAVIIEMPILLVAPPFLLIAPILFWAFTKVFVNISNSLKEINQKLKSE